MHYFQLCVNVLLMHILSVYIFKVGVNQQLYSPSMFMLNMEIA